MLLSSLAWADRGEISLRPELGGLWGAIRGGQEGEQLGTGVSLAYGLSFQLSLSLRYAWTQSGSQNLNLNDLERERWSESNQSALLGFIWAASDEWTPLLSLEAGGRRQSIEGELLRRGDQGERKLGILEETEWLPLLRMALKLEWRFLDAWSLAPGLSLSYSDGLSYGASLSCAAYLYLP